VLLDSLIEFATNAADGCLVADIGGAEAAAGQAAEVFSRFDDDRGFAHAAGLDRGCHAAAGTAVNYEVVRGVLSYDRFSPDKDEQEETEETESSMHENA
jgi:hypothetical protein